MEEEKIILGLVEVIEAAIKSGDWKVDGACDPDMILDMAEDYLRDMGWTRDGITGECWIRD